MTTTTTSSQTLGAGWRAASACAQVDPEIFYPLDLDPRSDGVRAAQRVCTSCPVLLDCLADALNSEDPSRRWGVIGGTTPDERAALYARTRPQNTRPEAVAA